MSNDTFPGVDIDRAHPAPPPATLTFGDALEAMKRGARMARTGWNGKGMFAYLVPANAYPAQTGAAKTFFGDDALVPYNAYFALKGVDGTVSTWAPSGSDALAEDWLVVDTRIATKTPLAGACPPHQQRVLEEKRDLDEKVAKLAAFFDGPIFAQLDGEEQVRLRYQVLAMSEYATVLGERIAAFTHQ